MLFNNEWRVSKDIHSLDNLIAWLETQPADKEYDYLNNQNCLLAQYLTASGVKIHSVAGHAYRTKGDPEKYIRLPESFQMIAVALTGVDQIYKALKPKTFGMALKRAREWKDKE